MKNKEKYELGDLDISIASSVNGCGKRIDPKHITVMYRNNIVFTATTYENPFKVLFRWLEQDDE